MIERIAGKITDRFISGNIIKAEEKEIYDYCFETTIVMGISYFILFFLALLFKEPLTSLIFLLSFLIFRKTCGGYHARNYIICGFMSLLSYLVLIFVIKKINIIFDFSFIFLIVGLVIIIAFSPIQDDNKPFTEKQFKRFKIISKSLAAIFIFVFSAFELLGFHSVFMNKYYFSFCYGIDLAAFALLISRIERSLKNAEV